MKEKRRLRFPSGTSFLKVWDAEMQIWNASLTIPLPGQQYKLFHAIASGIAGPLEVERKLVEQCTQWLKEQNQTRKDKSRGNHGG